MIVKSQNCLNCENCVGCSDLETYEGMMCNIDEPEVDCGECEHFDKVPEYLKIDETENEGY